MDLIELPRRTRVSVFLRLLLKPMLFRREISPPDQKELERYSEEIAVAFMVDLDALVPVALRRRD